MKKLVLLLLVITFIREGASQTTCLSNNSRIIAGIDYYGIVAGNVNGITSEGAISSGCPAALNQADIKGSGAFGNCSCTYTLPPNSVATSGDLLVGTCTQNTTVNGNPAGIQINSPDNTKPGMAIFSTAPQTSGTNGGAMITLYQNGGSAITSGTQLGALKMGGSTNNLNALNHGAGVIAIATENWNGSASGTDLVFFATPPGTNTPVEVGRETGSGTFRFPQKTLTQINAIPAPLNGEQVYDNTGGYMRTRSGGAWIPSSPTAWTSFTTTISAPTTNPTSGTGVTTTSYYTQIGKTLFVNYYYRQTGAGTGGSGQYGFSIPAGFTIDTTVVPSGDLYALIGQGWGANNVGNWFIVFLTPFNSTSYNAYYFNSIGSTPQPLGSAGGGLQNGPCTFTWQLTIPIVI